MFYKIKIIITFFFINLSIICCSQKKNVLEVYKYKPIPNKLLNENLKFNNVIPKDGYLINDKEIDFLNIKQTTDYIQKILDNNSKVILPNKLINISKDGLKLNSNQKLFFQTKTKLKIEKNNLNKYSILLIDNVENVTVENANLLGDRDEHINTEGEQGHGISILGSNNVHILGFLIENCWGDGIYVGMNNNIGSKNIVIKNGVVNNNRRNGISITNVSGLNLLNTISSNANGKDPMFGLDIEPNWSKNYQIKNININNFITFNNANGGMMIAVHKMAGEEKKNINIKVTNYTDLYSYHGIFFGGIPRLGNLSGDLIMQNIKLEENQIPIKFRDNNEQKKIKFLIDNLKIINPLNKSFTSKGVEKILLNKNIEFKNLE